MEAHHITSDEHRDRDRRGLGLFLVSRHDRLRDTDADDFAQGFSSHIASDTSGAMLAVSSPAANNRSVPSKLGNLLRSRREATVDPSTGRTYTRAGLGQAVGGLTDKAIEAIENGRTKTMAPAEARRFARVLGLTVFEICEAMGYELEAGDVTPEEREMVALYRRIPAEAQASYLASCRAIAIGAIQTFEHLAAAARRAPRGSS